MTYIFMTNADNNKQSPPLRGQQQNRSKTMILNIGDRVFAKTDIMRCAIIGTIKQEDGDRVLVVFDFKIRGIASCWVSRSACRAVEEPKNIEVKNRKMKSQARRVIDSLEVQK